VAYKHPEILSTKANLPMDSTLTLVDPAIHGRKTLVFSANSTLNAKLHVQPSGALAYTLKSNSVGDRTELLTPSGTVLASVYRRIIAPTGTVRGETRRLSKWFGGEKALCVFALWISLRDVGSDAFG
jgi:hypothetical protein